ncbi:hypothetical protein [Providencia phage vB_PreS-PatoteraRojo]|nr:hypothetical protein [Providencia phage vB_PreS-PatoteraRojo]
MSAPSPTLSALAVNAAVQPADMSNMVPVFQSIEKAYYVTIRLTHTGVQVRSRYGMGSIYFERGQWNDTKSGVATGQEECFAMRKYGLELLMWAREEMPTAEVVKFVKEVIGHEH